MFIYISLLYLWSWNFYVMHNSGCKICNLGMGVAYFVFWYCTSFGLFLCISSSPAIWVQISPQLLKKNNNNNTHLGNLRSVYQFNKTRTAVLPSLLKWLWACFFSQKLLLDLSSHGLRCWAYFYNTIAYLGILVVDPHRKKTYDDLIIILCVTMFVWLELLLPVYFYF